MRETIYVKFSNERNNKYKIRTEILLENGVKYVEKSALSDEAQSHILNMEKIYRSLCESSSINISKCEIVKGKARFEFIEGDTLAQKLDALVVNNDIDEAVSEIEKYFKAVADIKPVVKFESTEGFVSVFGERELSGEYDCCPVSNIDMVFDNIILNNGYNLIDYEWTFDFPVPFKFIMYRAINNFIYSNPKRLVIYNAVIERLGITEKEADIFDAMEESFQKYVSGSFVSRAFYKKLDRSNYPVVAWAEKKELDSDRYKAEIYADRGEGLEYLCRLSNVNKDGKGIIELDTDENVKMLRIDPLTNFAVITDVKITASGQEEAPDFITNGYKYSESCYVFDNEDVQFVITLKQGTSHIAMRYCYTVIEKQEAEEIIKGITGEREHISALEVNLNERQCVIDELNSSIRAYDKELRSAIEAHRADMTRSSDTIKYMDSVIKLRENQIEEIYNSTCWKITAPLRFTVGKTKSFFRNNPLTRRAYEFLFYVKRDGLRTTLESRSKKKAEKAIPVNGSYASENMSDITPLKSLDKKIAVHLHLFYVDLLDEFFEYFNNIPFDFDIYVSCKGGSNIAQITQKLKKLKHVKKVDVRETINRGRDIAPLYVQFAPEIEKYDYFLHVHSKKSLFTGKEQYGWRQFSLDCLLKDEDTVRRIFALFESNKKVGLFYPETFGEMHLIAQDWLGNAYNGRRLLDEMGIAFEDGFFNYPVGSFFWAKMDAVRPIFDRKLRYEDFPEEAGQTDGTIAHALERAIAFVVRSRGYSSAIHDIQNGCVSLGKSYKVYQQYFSLDYEAVQYHLSLFDVVSFDIFDTLITRCVYRPDDVFELMANKIKHKYGINCDFLSLRKKAEALAWEEKKEYTSINDIYNKLPDVMNISAERAEEIKAMEIELELKICIPREDMLRIFNHIKACGRKIVLVSDMYLTSDIVGAMLEKCGYTGYDDMWISCERGKRKDNSSMWEDFFNVYGQYNTVHVGDNPRSDIQLVGDMLKSTFFVMNPVTAFKMSRYYDKFRRYTEGTLTERLMLGMFINGGIYNSPFVQGSDGEPVIGEYDKLGYSAFGPLFTAFSMWLDSRTDSDSLLMFLSREGYIFEKVYNNVFAHMPKKDTCYFLASRRAMSVAAIRNEEDIRSILSQFYRGSFENLMLSRLGIKLYDSIENRDISMPEDIDRVMNILEPYFDDIYKRAEKERQSYLEYIASTDSRNRGIIVDVGYSGTIQYYMARLLENKQPGLYLCTWVDKKPDNLGCPCESMYPVISAEEEHTHKIFKNQLFLEAVLKAPFGQLICFERGENGVVPVYKSDSILGEGLESLQKGILDFSSVFGGILPEIENYEEYDTELPADMLNVCLESGWISERAGSIFTVQDDYCKNGSHKFNAAKKVWEVV